MRTSLGRGRTRKAKRKEQSRKDRTENFWKLAKNLSDPLAEYRFFIEQLKTESRSHRNDFSTIPMHLVDLTASLFVTLISGKRFELMGTGIANAIHGRTWNRNNNSTADTFVTSDASDSALDSDTYSPSQLGNKTSLGDNESNPSASLFSLISQIIRASQLSCTTFLLAVILTIRCSAAQKDKCNRRRNRSITNESINASQMLIRKRNSSKELSQRIQNHMRLFVGAIISADKYLYDATFSNKAWVELLNFKYTLEEINCMEHDFLEKIQFNLFVSESEFIEFLDYMDWLICVRQLSKWRYWPALTYKDLVRLSSMKPKVALQFGYPVNMYETCLFMLSRFFFFATRLAALILLFAIGAIILWSKNSLGSSWSLDLSELVQNVLHA